MYVYLISNSFIFITSIICENIFCIFKGAAKFSSFFYKFWCFILLFLSAFRYGIGTDYNVYYNEYLHALNGSINFNLVSYIIKLLRLCNLPFQIIIIACSCSFLLPIFYLTYKLCYNYKLFSLGVLMGLSYYVYSYNIFRQCAAIGLMLFFLFRWVYTSKNRYIFALIIPILIHPSSLIALVFYYLISKMHFKYRTLKALSCAGILVFLFVPESIGSLFVKNFIQLFTNTIYGGYATSQDINFLARIYNQNMEFVPKILIIPFLIALPIMLNRLNYSNKILVHYRDKSHLINVQEYFLKMYFCYFMVMSLKIGSEIVSRFLMYFSIVSIWAIPMLLESRDINKWIKRMIAIFIIAVSIYYHVLWLKGNGCEAYPYQNIFLGFL